MVLPEAQEAVLEFPPKACTLQVEGKVLLYMKTVICPDPLLKPGGERTRQFGSGGLKAEL
jgi:hypothetical protein